MNAFIETYKHTGDCFCGDLLFLSDRWVVVVAHHAHWRLGDLQAEVFEMAGSAAGQEIYAGSLSVAIDCGHLIGCVDQVIPT